VTSEVVVAAAGVAAGGLVQSATGFGFALVAAPLTTAAFGPVEAVPTVTVVSLVVSLLTLAGEGRRPEVLRRSAAILIAAGVPGMAIGAVILAQAPEDVLRAGVAVVVTASVAAVAWAPRTRPQGGPATYSGVGAGLLGGLLATTSGVNGPALLLHLRRVGSDAMQTRDTLAVVFLASGVLIVGVLAVGDTLHLRTEVVLLVVAAAVGQGLGRLAFAALEGHREAATRCVLALSVAAATVPAVQALG
jgi:uncharacterized membrane protein YfcA